MQNSKKISRYLFIYPTIFAFIISLLMKKYNVINTNNNEFSISFFIYFILLLTSGMSAFIMPSKKKIKGSSFISLTHKELLTRALLINLPFAVIFIYVFFTHNTERSLFYVLHLIIFNLTYITITVCYYTFIKNKGAFVDSFNKKLEHFSSNNDSPIAISDFTIKTLNDEMVHLNDAYAIMRLTSYSQLLDQNVDKYYEYQNTIRDKFINEEFSGRLAFETDQLLLKYFQKIDNPEYHKTVEIEEWMINNYYDPATLIIRYYEKEPDERIEYIQSLEKDELILRENPNNIGFSKTVEFIDTYLITKSKDIHEGNH